MGFRDVARREMVGPETPVVIKGRDGQDIDTGLKIKPKKLSQVAFDRIGNMRRAFLRDPRNKGHMKDYREVLQKLEREKKTIDDLSNEEAASLMENQPVLDDTYNCSICAEFLRAGIAEHNVDGSDGKIVGDGKKLDDATIDELLDQFPPIAMRMQQIIEEWDHP